MLAGIFGQTWSFGRITQNAGTKINRLVNPKQNKRTKLTRVEVTTGATAHTLTCMRPLGKTTLSAAAAAGQAVIVLTADPGVYSAVNSNFKTADNAIAANDFVVIKCKDGTTHLGVVSSVSGLNITLTANVPTGGFASGATVWFYGIFTDTNPLDGLAHPIFTLAASVSNVFSVDEGSVAETLGMNEPMILQIDNATNASVLEFAAGCYGP